MLDPKRIQDLAALVFALGLGALALIQWRAGETFVEDAVLTQAEVVSTRTAKQNILEPIADVFVTVTFTAAGGEVVEAELPRSTSAMGLRPDPAEGSPLTVRYDPRDPSSVRYGEADDQRSALVLALLAVGALFVPGILRRASMTPGGG